MARKDGGTERTIDNAEQDMRCARLRARGHSYRKIAATEEVSVSSAYRSVQRAIAAVPVEAVNELRAIECQRLDAIIAKAWDIVEASHPYISNGKFFADVEDSGPVLSALTVILRTSESKRKLLGLDAPQRRIVEVITEDAVDAEIRRLEMEIAQAAAEDAAASA